MKSYIALWPARIQGLQTKCWKQQLCMEAVTVKVAAAAAARRPMVQLCSAKSCRAYFESALSQDQLLPHQVNARYTSYTHLIYSFLLC